MTRIALIISLSLALGSCKKEEDPPPLPPAGSLSSDISALTSAPNMAKNADPEGSSEYTNFANAWLRVAVVNVYATGVVLIPALTITAALTQEADKDGDTWTWVVSGNDWSATLTLMGALGGWDVALYVTNQEVTDFLWVEGTSNLAVTDGTWTLHDPNQDPGAASDVVLTIDWLYTSDTERSLTYTNVNETSPDVGDTLTYAISGTSASVTFEDADQPSQIADITWDTVTGEGAIEVPGYNEGDPACWDSSFTNTACN